MSTLRLGVRALGVALAVAFVALLGYGLLSRSPDTTIDDSLAAARPAAGPELRAAGAAGAARPCAACSPRWTAAGSRCASCAAGRWC